MKQKDLIDRRDFLAASLSATGVLLGCAASASSKPAARIKMPARRLSARPPVAPPQGKLLAEGLQGLGLGGLRDGYVYVPGNHTAAEPLPLLVLLHGATGSSTNFFGSYGKRAEEKRMIVLAPDSRQGTWDIAVGGYQDVAFIDEALALVFKKCAVHPKKIALGGFSDGASYALSLGLTNGDLFDHLIAFSPGFVGNIEQHGAPKIFISHGTQDTILPIDTASRRIVAELRKAHYDVDYREFEGGHRTPPEMADAAMNWLASAYR